MKAATLRKRKSRAKQREQKQRDYARVTANDVLDLDPNPRKTETEAKAKLQEWLDKKITVKTDDDGKEIPVNVGRGTANNGKVWMINHAMKSRARVAPEEVDNFKSNGYILGGPKSAFV